MKSHVRMIRQMAKKMISYEIEGEEKAYRLKHTPFCIKRHYTRRYHRELEKLPVRKDKIIFDNYKGGGYGCNGKYVTEELLKRNEKCEIVWTVQDPEKQRPYFPDAVRLVKYGSPEAMFEYATAGIWAGNYHLVHYLNKGLLKKPEQTYIQMWHGSFGIKKIENDCANLAAETNWAILARRNSEYTDYWISNSGFETAVYRQAFWDVGEVLEYGHPRNDIFFHGRERKARHLAEQYLGMDHKKLLLYAPTFRDDFKAWEEPLHYERLRQSLQGRFGGEWAILVRLHPRMKTYAKERPGEGCIDVTDYPDIQELLAAADAVITDYSSSVFDFLLTGRPAFLYAADYEAYRNMRGLYYPLEDTPFPIAFHNRQMEKNIAEFDEAAYRIRVREFLKGKDSKEDGGAAKRVADFIIKKQR